MKLTSVHDTTLKMCALISKKERRNKLDYKKKFHAWIVCEDWGLAFSLKVYLSRMCNKSNKINGNIKIIKMNNIEYLFRCKWFNRSFLLNIIRFIICSLILGFHVFLLFGNFVLGCTIFFRTFICDELESHAETFPCEKFFLLVLV